MVSMDILMVIRVIFSFGKEYRGNNSFDSVAHVGVYDFLRMEGRGRLFYNS
jgi:hypothetical protein